MIFSYFDILLDSPLSFLMLIAAMAFSLLVGLVFHEFSHAYVADSLGDGTPRRAGRLTLDPRAHLDPFGSLLIVIAGFGWARPTPVNPNYTKNPQLSMLLIALGGPASNLVIAGLAAIPMRLGMIDAGDLVLRAENLPAIFLFFVVLLNINLAVFNFLPLAPLDGYRMVAAYLPRRYYRELQQLEQWSLGILMLLFFLPVLTNGQIDFLGKVLRPAVAWVFSLLTGASL